MTGGVVERVEWRVVGDPGEEFPPYRFTFESEEKARGFVAAILANGRPWVDGPHIERRTVTETPWVRP